MTKRWRPVALLGLAGALLVATSASGGRDVLGPGYGKGEKAVLTGSVEVPPGDPDGTGTAEIRLDPTTNLVCYEVDVANVDFPIAAMHIHKGPAGTAGPVVVPLKPPLQNGATNTGHVAGCAAADAALIQDIIDHPDQYYVNTHNTQYPAGVVRGQLTKIVDVKPKPKPKPKKPKPKKKHKKKGH